MKAYQLNHNIIKLGDEQMAWFKKQMAHAHASKKNIIICGHIPPGYSTYKNESNFWIEKYSKAYVEVIYKHSDVVTAQLFGHVHEDKVKVQKTMDEFLPSKRKIPAKSFSLICPSITPIYQSNPAFRLFTLNSEDRKLLDYSQYYMDFTLANVYKNPVWQLEYTFFKLYSKLNTDSVNNLVENLIALKDSSWTNYHLHMKALYGGISTYTRYDEYCASRHFTENAFHNCLKYYKQHGL